MCLVEYSLPATAPADGAEEEAAESYHTFQIPVFFGLLYAGFGHLFRWVRGLTISQTAGEKMEVFVAPSMYADFTPDTVEGKVKVCDCPMTQGYIKKKSYNGLCCMPTEVGGSASTYFCDYFYNNAASPTGFRVRAAGGSASHGAHAGASCTYANYTASTATANFSSPLCFFTEDPEIE